MALTAEEKRRFLRALEEDWEFRYAVAGLLGYREILEELKELRKKSLEHDKRFEAIEKKLLEHDEKFEAILEELKAHRQKLLEHDRRLEAIEKELRELNRRVSRLEMTVGALSESFYSKAFWDDLREELRASGERVLLRRRNARVDGVDVDLLVVTDKRVYVVEVKVKPRIEDVGALLAKTDVVKRYYPDKEIVPILAGTMIGREVEDYANMKGVKVYAY